MLKNYTKMLRALEAPGFVYYNDDNKMHRLDGPAVECSNGIKTLFYVFGKAHRNIGPSVERIDDYGSLHLMFEFNGKIHRIGSPANKNGYGANINYEYYISNIQYTKKNYYNKVWDI